MTVSIRFSDLELMLFVRKTIVSPKKNHAFFAVTEDFSGA